MRRRLAALAVAAAAAFGLTGCWNYPHSDRTLAICASLGWESVGCSVGLCLDYQNHFGGYYSNCPAAIRYGTGMR